MLTLSSADILYCDDVLLIVAKPAGIPSDTTPDPRRDTLVAAAKRWSGTTTGPWIHNRLDVDTSGIVVFARTAQVNAAVGEAFASREAAKTYLAVVSPPLEVGQQFGIRNHLRRNRNGTMEVVRSGGDRAETEFEVLDSSTNASLVCARPRTGRMHQIRVHLAGLGSPIVGDTQYGGADSRYRLLLHAWRLRIPHPVDGTIVEVECPLPVEFETALATIGLRGPAECERV
jgi:RluA family pseudouridine synthase